MPISFPSSPGPIRQLLWASVVATSATALAPSLLADDSNPGFTAEAVKETLAFLSSDDLLGRDTPSAGLRTAAEHIAQRFEAAGLEPMNGSSYFLTFQKPGQRLDASTLKVQVTVDNRTIDLVGGDDVRIFSAGGAFEGTDLSVTVFDPKTTGMREMSRDRESPILISTEIDSPLWAVTEGTRDVLSGRRRGPPRPPTLLIRAGAVPTGDATWTITLPAPEAVELTLENVAAIRRGAKRPNEAILFGAHYDHIGVRIPSPPRSSGTSDDDDGQETKLVEWDAIMNGADDDASGTTAVVHLAEAFAALEEAPDRTVGFLCFTGEEKGLLGSRAFCDDPPFALEEIVALFNIEMIGRPHEDKDGTAWVTGPAYSNFEELVTEPFRSAGVELIDFRMQERLFTASDNAPFARKGVVAHSISAGSLHNDYHGPNDEIDRIHIYHMATVIKGIFSAGRSLANLEGRPEWTDAGRKALKLEDE